MSDRYEVKGRLGRGGIGAIYHAYDHHLGRVVAIKRLLPLDKTNLNEAVSADSLKQEAKALAALSHPNIVTIHEFSEDDQGPYVVCELIDGDTIKEIVQDAALSEYDFFEVAEQILDALAAAHEVDIIHRDIKPANIMLSWLPSGKFQIKILDFGLSKFTQKPRKQTLDQKGSFLGSIDYIAPEQLELQPLDQRTDLYSLGCVLYFALTQKPPFAGGNVSETINNHIKGKVEPLKNLRPDLDPAACSWVMWLLSPHPEERPNSSLEALEGLQAVRNNLGKDQNVNISTGEPVVPVAESAQPTNIERELHYTAQIIATPSPSADDTATAPLPTASISKPKNPNKGKKRLWLILGLIGIAIVAGRLWPSAPRQKDLDRASIEAPANLIYENQRHTALDLPRLPREDALVSYYSVQGPMQPRSGDPKNGGAILGALENIAPSADPFHLLRSPDELSHAPVVQPNESGQLTILFSPQQQLLPPSRAFKNRTILSKHFTFALVYRVPKDTNATLLQVNLDNQPTAIDATTLSNGWRLSSAFAKNSRTELTSAEETASGYQVAIVEYNGAANTLKLERFSPELDAPELGPLLKLQADPTPTTLTSYKIGHLSYDSDHTSPPEVEIPALSIHRCLLTPGEKQELSKRLLSGALK